MRVLVGVGVGVDITPTSPPPLLCIGRDHRKLPGPGQLTVNKLERKDMNAIIVKVWGCG